MFYSINWLADGTGPMKTPTQKPSELTSWNRNEAVEHPAHQRRGHKLVDQRSALKFI